MELRADAVFWISAYRESIPVMEEAVLRMQILVQRLPPGLQREAELLDLPPVVAHLARIRARLDFWEG